MIENHFRYTGSSVAKFILEDFDNQLNNFIKVFPIDYKRVLAAKQVAAIESINDSNASINNNEQAA